MSTQSLYYKHNTYRLLLEEGGGIYVFPRTITNLIKTRIVTRSPLLRKPHYMSHVSDPTLPSNENGDYDTMKVLLHCFACYEQSDWSKKVSTIFIVSLYVHDIRRSLKSGNIAKDHDTLGIHVLIWDRHTIVCVCMYGRAVNGSMASQR